MIQWFRQKNYAKEIALMDIVALLEVLVKGLLDAENKFFENPKDF